MMRNLWKGLMIAALAAVTGSAAEVKGVLIDKQCSSKAETHIVPGPRLEGGILVAYNHTRQCALMPACQKSGYGVFTYDQKYLTFDAAGNQKALAALKASVVSIFEVATSPPRFNL